MSDDINSFHLTKLSTNLLFEVVKYLTLVEVCKLSRTCQRLYAICSDPLVWSDFLPGVPEERKKTVFLKRLKIKKHVEKRKVLPYILQGHSDMILSLCVRDSEILSASRDNTVKKWDISTKKGLTYEGHGDWVVDAQFCEGGVISISSDRTVRLWNEGPDAVKIWREHRAGVTCLKMVTPTLAATGSHDFSVKLWDVKRKQMVGTYMDHTSAIHCLDAFDGMLVSGTVLDGKVLLRDLETGSIVHTLLLGNRAPGARVTLSTSNELHSLLLTKNLLFTGEAEKVRMWDLRAKSAQDSMPVPKLTRSQSVKEVDGSESEASVPEVTKPPLKHNTYSFTEKHARGVFRMKYLEDAHWMLAGCMGLCGLAGFDLRNKQNQLYIKAHDYPILGMDAQSQVMNDIAITSGTTTNYRYEVAAYSISRSELITSFAPSHKAVITALRLGDEMMVSGAKDGSLVALTFNNYSETLRRSAAAVKIHNFSAPVLRA